MAVPVIDYMECLPPPAACGNCRFFVHDSTRHNAQEADCYLRPPVFVAGFHGTGAARRPTVYAGDFCREHEPKGTG